MDPAPPDPVPEDAQRAAVAWSESVYGELRGLAANLLRGQASHTLQPTALVHEAYVRIVQSGGAKSPERRRFFALAGKAMRSVLVDHARRNGAQKRDHGQRITLSTALTDERAQGYDVLDLHEAIEELGALDPELVRIADLLLFAGLTAGEAAEVLEVSARTVERGWRTARAFLQQRLRTV